MKIDRAWVAPTGRLAELARAGVRYRALGEVGAAVSGLSGKTKADFADGDARYLPYKSVFVNPEVDESSAEFVRVEPGEAQNELHRGDVVFTSSSENVEDVGLSSVVVREPDRPLYLNSFCFAWRFFDPDLILPEFSKHLFRSAQLRSAIRQSAAGVTRINISKKLFSSIRIPLPPIDVQREISGILDVLASLEAELATEADLRKRLFGEFRRRTMRRDGIRMQLRRFATQHVEPVRVDPSQTYTNLGVKWYGQGAFTREAKSGSAIKGTTLFRVKPGQFIYNRMFVTEGSFGIVTPDLAHGVVSSEFPVFDIDRSLVLPEWLFLKFQEKDVVDAAAAQTVGGTRSRRRWKEDQFLAFAIDIPPIAEQEEAVERARAFAELSQTIEAERDARRKQYEYYRDKLLTLPEAIA